MSEKYPYKCWDHRFPDSNSTIEAPTAMAAAEEFGASRYCVGGRGGYVVIAEDEFGERHAFEVEVRLKAYATARRQVPK